MPAPAPVADDVGDGDAEIDDDAQHDERPCPDDNAERPADLEIPHAQIPPMPRQKDASLWRVVNLRSGPDMAERNSGQMISVLAILMPKPSRPT